MTDRSLAELPTTHRGRSTPTPQSLGTKSATTITSDAGRVTQPVGDATRGGLRDGPNAIGYVRVSTDKQADEGLSLEAQTAKIRAMAVVRGVAVADVIVDAESAKSLNRRGLAWLLAQVDAGAVGTVIIAKLDRLTRSVKDLWPLLERFERRHVTLISVAETFDTSTAIGRAMLNLIATMSQWEREAIGERTRDVLQHKRAKGERVGTIPLGFQLAADGVHLEPNTIEQDRLARIRDLRATGRSTRTIAAALNADGVTTRRGTPWRFQYVARALKAS